MYLKGIKRKDIEFITQSLRYGKERYIEYATKTCGSYRKETIIEYDRIIDKLKEVMKHE